MHQQTTRRQQVENFLIKEGEKKFEEAKKKAAEVKREIPPNTVAE